MTVRAVLGGEDATVRTDRRTTITDALEAAGYAPPATCRSGSCSTCVARVLDGTTSMSGNYALGTGEVSEGLVRTCQATAASSTVTVDFDDTVGPPRRRGLHRRGRRRQQAPGTAASRGVSAPAPHSFVARVIEEYDNAIHRDDVAQQFGFTGALVPGVELFARTTTPLVAAWGEQWLSGGRVELRFRRPTYDGEQLLVDLDGTRLTVRGPDGEVRCVGSADRTAEPPDLSGYAEVAAPSELPVDPIAGPLASVHEPVSVEQNDWYLEAVAEPLTLYRERSVAHPGVLLRLVNQLLIRNVALGPWIHTASDCTFLGLARLPAAMTVHGRVTEVGRRGNHDRVAYDALILAGAEPVLQVSHTALYRLSRG